jgi:hypothetical protein
MKWPTNMHGDGRPIAAATHHRFPQEAPMGTRQPLIIARLKLKR